VLVAAGIAACSAKPPASTTVAATSTAKAVAAAPQAHPGKQATAPPPAVVGSMPPMAYDDSRGLIVALGDSITSGAGNSGAAKTYIGQLSVMLRTRSVNLGGYGLTSDVTAHAVPSIPEQATNVVIYVGTNDVAAAASHSDPALAAKRAKTILAPDLDKLVDAVRARVPRAQIVLVTVRDQGRSGVHGPDVTEPSLTAAVHEWDDHERRYAADHGITAVLDTETDPQWYVKSEYMPNGIQPNDAGAARLAAALAPLIKHP